MALAPGTRLGPYEILSSIGAGGMGEVYRARDVRVQRVVAIKLSKDQFSERFEREARAVAALNHPHICQLYDVGPDYLVMEYIEGKALAGPMPIPEALRIASQIVDALDAAHAKGIVHRDLKPDNILITRSGSIKLLDFGLAKVSASAVTPVSDAAPTGTLTQPGTILGTLRYMSPEQVQGHEADSRSDIFAFGTVLYEVLAARPAFGGPNPASVIAAILTSEPPAIAALDSRSSPALDRLIRRCLAKDPEARWQSARDLGEALKWIGEGTAPAPTLRPAAPRSRTVWIAAALVTVAAAVFSAYVMSAARQTPRAMRLNLPGPVDITIDGPVLSPDGSRIAFASHETKVAQLWIRSLYSFQAQRLDGAEDPSQPFWSPDSNEIAVASNGKLQRFDLTAQTHRPICDLPNGDVSFTGSWGTSGIILLSDDDSIYRVPASGGELERVTRVDRSRGDLKHVMPHFLPDGRRFLFLAVNQRNEDSGIFEGSIDGAPVQRIMANPVGPVHVIGRNLIFARGSALMAQPFDWKSGRLQGAAASLQENVSTSLSPYAPVAAFSISSNTLVYYPPLTPRTELVWVDREGNHLGSVGGTAHYTNPSLSPDQKRIAVGITDPPTNQRDIWILDSRGGSMRLTSDPKDDLNPAWSPDGTRIAFTSDRLGVRDIFVKPADGTGSETVVVSSSNHKAVDGWSPDGKILIYTDDSIGALMGVAVTGENRPFPITAGPGLATHGAISPDGKWIAYQSSDRGRTEVYLQNFPAGATRWPLSTNGGAEPSWRRDGKELYFVRDQELFAVNVSVTPEGVEHSVPKHLFTAPFNAEFRRNRYVPAADGHRFLLVLQAEQRGRPMNVVLNWSATLRDK